MKWRKADKVYTVIIKGQIAFLLFVYITSIAINNKELYFATCTGGLILLLIWIIVERIVKYVRSKK